MSHTRRTHIHTIILTRTHVDTHEQMNEKTQDDCVCVCALARACACAHACVRTRLRGGASALVCACAPEEASDHVLDVKLRIERTCSLILDLPCLGMEFAKLVDDILAQLSPPSPFWSRILYRKNTRCVTKRRGGDK